jgi:leucyl aminopeptidase
VDVTTLTGAMVTTLGKACTGVMGNNQEFLDQVTAAGRQAGSISAAFLLAEFVGDTPWVHMDIAGTSTADRTKGHQVKGATGVPARTLARLASNLAENAL